MTSKLNSLIESGIAAQQSGDLDTALSHYQAAFELAPEDAEVLSLLGLALTLLGRHAEAEPLLRDAVAREPGEIGFRINLTELLLRQGLLGDAREEVTRIVSQNPGFSPAWERLGDIAIRQGDKSQAKEYYQKAFSTVSGNFHIGLKLAELQIVLGEYDQALNMLNSIARQGPDNPALFSYACLAIKALQDWQQLESVSRNWARAHANDPAAWQMLATALMEQGRYRLAEESYRKVLSNRSENAADLSAYGQICLQCFEYDRAKDAFDRAEVLDPELPDLLVGLSILYTYFGEFGKAENYCRRVLQYYPGFAPAYVQLGHLTRGQFSDTERESLVALQSDVEQAAEHRIDLAFTLGRVHEARQEYQAAYEAYDVANGLGQDLGESLKLHYDEKESAARTRGIKALYRPDVIQQSLDNASPCPVFIVGMPRSGTTLIESVIAAHSSVVAGGERPLLPQINNSALSFSSRNDNRLPPAETLKEWAGSYLSDLPEMGTADYFTDKNPLNIEAVGLIAVLFPNAPIVHIRRNPVETCFSIFKHRFSKFWSFTHSLSDIAHFYGQYAQLVSYWEAALADRFLTIQYEELATDLSAFAPVLIEHCGLQWQSQCLDFQKANRAIATLSSVQIREPVKVHNTVAKNYQEFTGPLIEVLRSAGVDLDTGALIEQERC